MQPSAASLADSQSESAPSDDSNISTRLRQWAEQQPHSLAIIEPNGRDRLGRPIVRQLSFAGLDREVDELAAGFSEYGIQPGDPIVLMVRAGLDFISLTFALFRAGAVVVLIDPGMGLRSVFRCLDEVDPAGFVAIPPVQVARALRWNAFRNATKNVCVGPKVFGSESIAAISKLGRGRLSQDGRSRFNVTTGDSDPAAIIFTSGSTGPAKGVCYEHKMFAAQAEMIRSRFKIEPGDIDLPCFPLFGLFAAAIGVTTVIPEMNPTKPAEVDPAKIVDAIRDFGVTQAFGSPAVWNRVGPYCEKNGIRFPGLKRVLSAGAPVPISVLESMSHCLTFQGAELHTPYGATESLPVTSIGSREVLEETRALTERGRGTCVGRPFDGVAVKVIQPVDGPIDSIDDVETLPAGEIGEIIVSSRSTTRQYFRRVEQTAAAKVDDPSEPGRIWHRMGDMGSLDDQGRLWFCGRKAHVVHTKSGPLYSVCCEAPFLTLDFVGRAALVGVGDRGSQRPVIVIELAKSSGRKTSNEEFIDRLVAKAAEHDVTRSIERFLFHPSFPVDIRHNVKINREALAEWAKTRVASGEMAERK
ncbi:fatty acid CoA ligase family protein [Stratiformator vulcanicus]|uniref:Tyrocidine synthase 3 n=1 Tax=Stratiformator vulcanicus TaxID=2527980 RepID=A0A517R1T2_9PLAN|nr:fatty acid CoA ligase family protein [Stratiformator vulcanicus]QDT37855.1 Tyrocidine synthase 3 [Stratiformator vulcanicus]